MATYIPVPLCRACLTTEKDPVPMMLVMLSTWTGS